MSSLQKNEIVRLTADPGFLKWARKSYSPQTYMFNDEDGYKIHSSFPVIFSRWKWVLVNDLRNCLKDHIFGSKVTHWTVIELLQRYALVNKQEDFVGFLTWISESSWTLHASSNTVRANASRLPELAFQSTYIPEPWSNRILDLFGRGVMAVEASEVELIAIMDNGEKRSLRHQGADRYMILPDPLEG